MKHNPMKILELVTFERNGLEVANDFFEELGFSTWLVLDVDALDSTGMGDGYGSGYGDGDGDGDGDGSGYGSGYGSGSGDRPWAIEEAPTITPELEMAGAHALGGT